VLVFASTYIAFCKAFPEADGSQRKAGAVFAGAAGFLVTAFLLENPDLLDRYSLEIVVGLLGILLAFIAFLRRVFR
jgi:hypothetical protein